MTLYSSRHISDDVSLTDALEFFILKKLLGVHTLLLCEILTVDYSNPASPKMTLQSLINNINNNFAPVDPPKIFSVPCTAIRGGDAGIIIEYKEHDKVLIGIVERQIDNVIRSGKRSTPALHRMHSLEDAIVIAYIPTDKSSQPKVFIKITDAGIEINSNNQPLTITAKSATISVHGNADINVTGNANINATGDLKLKGANVEIEGTLKINGQEYLEHKHTAGTYTAPPGGGLVTLISGSVIP